MQETRVLSLGWEDHLEKEMATRSSILAGESHGQRSQAGSKVHGVTRARHDLMTKPPPTNGIIQFVTCGVWLLSLSVMFSRFSHVVVSVSTSFLLMIKQYSIG